MPLPSIADIRRFAAVAGLAEITHNETSRVVSFATAAVRFNCYYTTGTVGTCMDHPTKGKTQLFRRNQGHSDLQRIFSDPRVHTGGGYYRTSSGGAQKRQRLAAGGGGGTLQPSSGEPADEETELRAHAAELACEETRIKSERAEVAAMLAVFEAERARKAAQAEQRKKQAAAEKRIAARGEHVTFWAHHGKDLDKMFDRTCSCIAMSEYATIFLYDSTTAKDWAYTEGLPKWLHNKLNGRASSHPAPTYCAMGTRDRYYIEFDNGSSEWVCASAGFVTAVNRRGKYVNRVAFGDGELGESWFVLFDDGSYEWNNMPCALEAMLASKKGVDIKELSLGPDDEYFLLRGTGTCQFSGSAAFLKAMKKWAGGGVKSVLFGRESYLIRY